VRVEATASAITVPAAIALQSLRQAQGGRDATPALGKAMTMAFGLFGLLEEAEPLLFFHGEAYDLLAAAGLAFEQLQLAFLRKRKCNACGVLT